MDAAARPESTPPNMSAVREIAVPGGWRWKRIRCRWKRAMGSARA